MDHQHLATQLTHRETFTVMLFFAVVIVCAARGTGSWVAHLRARRRERLAGAPPEPERSIPMAGKSEEVVKV